jgi:bifunctional DNA-binding transcriptional regulator/antitoxin component of YhaV-PrlF toxin-antitoxin module
MRRLTRSLSTKADKIRALGRAGVGPADIGRFLGIRYQQAYNVLKRSGISSGVSGIRDAERTAASAPARAVLDERGRILLPDRILESWSASPGEELLVRLEGDELRILTRSAGLRLAREVLRKYPRSDKSMADELIAERRREAEQDNG